jgi:hypothetical protein
MTMIQLFCQDLESFIPNTTLPDLFRRKEGLKRRQRPLPLTGQKAWGTPLVAYLCEQQHMHEDQVSKYLTDYVTEISELMANGKKVELEKIGIFSFDQDGSFNFDPDLR